MRLSAFRYSNSFRNGSATNKGWYAKNAGCHSNVACRAIVTRQLRENMASSAKPEVHNILQRCQKGIESGL